MRALVPWLIGIAVAAIAIVAAIDAVQGGKPRTVATLQTAATPAETVPGDTTLDSGGDAQTLRRRGATGELVYTEPGCLSAKIRLPELTSEALGISLDCPPATRRGWTAVASQETLILPRVCLRENSPPQGCDAVALHLERVRAAIGATGPISIAEIAWLGALRVAAIVHDHDRNLDVLAIFEGRELVRRPVLAGARLSGFGVSPLRRHLAVRSSTGGIFVLDWEGRFALPGRFRFPLLETRAVAWSPDDAWTALATRNRLYLLETDPSTRHVIELPLAAIGLDWQR